MSHPVIDVENMLELIAMGEARLAQVKAHLRTQPDEFYAQGVRMGLAEALVPLKIAIEDAAGAHLL